MTKESGSISTHTNTDLINNFLTPYFQEHTVMTVKLNTPVFVNLDAYDPQRVQVLDTIDKRANRKISVSTNIGSYCGFVVCLTNYKA